MKDLESFNIPCVIGGLTINHALRDLGSSVNIMPIGPAHKLGIGEGKPTSISIKFGDRALVQPKGLVLDVLVKVGGFLFPTNFCIMDIPEDPEIPIVIGRPFLATSQADINMKRGEMTLECMGEKLLFKASRVDLDSPQDCLALEDDKKKDDTHATHEDKENTPINQEVPPIFTFSPYSGVFLEGTKVVHGNVAPFLAKRRAYEEKLAQEEPSSPTSSSSSEEENHEDTSIPKLQGEQDGKRKLKKKQKKKKKKGTFLEHVEIIPSVITPKASPPLVGKNVRGTSSLRKKS